MKNYELVIRDLHQPNDCDAMEQGVLNSMGILNSFDAISWRCQQLIQMQEEKGNTAFTITDPDTDYSMRLILCSEPGAEQPEFRLVSDIEIVIPQKILLGLVTRKTRDYISFNHLSLKKAREFLDAFMSGQLDFIRSRYLAEMEKTCQKTSYELYARRS